MSTNNENNEKVQQILNNVIEVGFEGVPIPNWEKTDPFNELQAQYNIPGVGIVVIQDFKVEWTRFFGFRSKFTEQNCRQELDTNTLFEAASATKPVVTVALLHLVEKGELDLDADVNTYFKEWKIPENDFTKDEKVTLRRLLTHTAGVNPPDSMFSYEEGSTPTLLNVLNGESPAINDPVKIEFIPGSKHKYSNLGYVIIQKIMEDVTGKSLNQILNEIIFTPLQMNPGATTVEYQLPLELAMNTIVHHDQDGNPAGKGLHPSAFAQGNLSINPFYFAKFVVEIMESYQGKSNKILSQEMTRKMLESYHSFEPNEMMGITDQALGFFLMKNEKNTFFLLPGSNAPGANCMLLGSPLTGQGAVIMTNGAMGELLNLRLTYTLAKAYDWNFGV